MKVNETAVRLAEEAYRQHDGDMAVALDVAIAEMTEPKQYTKRLCADLLANLEHLADLTGYESDRFVNVTLPDTKEGRRLQSRLWELKYWGLAMPSGHRDGLHAITKLGVEFLMGGALVPVSVRVQNDQVIEEVGGRWNYVSALNAATKS